MARSHSKHTEVTVDSDDLSAFTDTSEFKPTGGTEDVTTYGNDGHVYDRTLTDGKFTMGGVYDTTAATSPRAVLLPLVKTGAVTVVHKPEGTGTGKPQDSFSGLLESYTETAPVADFRKWQAEFQISGDVTTTSQP
jgi:hypothetical protein